jgi:hypothetical protein
MSNVTRLSLLPLGALVSWGLWIAEVCWIKGWTGLAWLSGFNWSTVPISALIVTVASYVVVSRTPRSARMSFIGVGWIVTLAAFAIGRQASFELFSGPVAGRQGHFAVIVLASTGIILSVCLVGSASRWLRPLHYWTTILVAVGFVLVLPLSFVTIRVFPAFNGSTDQIHAIKMGYPVFWATLLVPIALFLGRKRRSDAR